ncbi:hypothetical protein DWX96_05880 [Roseburia sp. AF22-2LB]|jgi:hypothetical protein|uniref:hypothetical protein n=1 Tax=unclassified Roseburia TaxID=2637578 RepID=UPI000E52F202|nr:MULTISPECIES: hypothetical protein [unclassified Roseburia]RGG39288.1 hypothetical protein DWY00_05515 [Roseburia sp. AF22-8AC]RGG43033.1 hypothetical protein DWX96_05880 [Roseburia sp. AF22-2LB]
MKNKVFRLVVVTILMSIGICGCQKAPERSANRDILHAKDSVEDEMAAIVNESESAMENDMQEINSTIGTGDNVITIRAQMPDVPQNVYNMVLGENETLTKDVLTEFLGSETGNIKDLSEEAQKEMEQIKEENEQGEERAEYSVFGNAPIYKLSDEQKTASFSYGTGAYYQDELLYEKCASIYKSADETVLKEADSKNVYMNAEKILLAKLSLIGMTEIDIYKITQYQKENVTFYEIEFTPSYEGMGIVHEFGSITSGEIFPSGKAWICEESIATLSLDACIGKVETQEKCETVLSWSQIEKILETNLNSGKINGSNKAVLTEVEFLYYPIYKEDENKLELVPVWHIYTPMSVWTKNEELAEAFTENGSIWSICVNAVSGEIVRSE